MNEDFGTKICSICGKTICRLNFSSYAWKRHNAHMRTEYFCSYSCMRKAEALEKAQKQKRKERSFAKSGNPFRVRPGSTPIGLKVEGDHYEIDEKQAEAVKTVFERYSEGATRKELLSLLSCYGISASKHTLYHMLTNKRYLGIGVINGREVTDVYPKIISSELFALASKRRQAYRLGGM